MNLNNEMLYQMFLNSVKNMNDDELKNALNKSKSFLGENDYQKLVELISKERNIQI